MNPAPSSRVWNVAEIVNLRKPRKFYWVVGVILFATLAAFAWFRTGMLDLPAVPANLTLDESGLSGLDQMKQLNDLIWSTTGTNSIAGLTPAAALVHSGIATLHRGETNAALEQMRQGVLLDPNNLVLANAYRMVVFGLRRDFLAVSRRDMVALPKFPTEIEHEPIAFFQTLDRQYNTRETKLDLALAWVDEMLLFPALEVKAPSSVESVNLLTQEIDDGNPGYVPALYARGLNQLHRPSRLVWPESAKTPPDAAAQDIGKCIAIGRKFHAGSAHLQATLAISLGDAYVKAGRIAVAHSWWQIAQNLCRDNDIQAAIQRRFGWQNDEILDHLEEELDRSRSELEHPMTDLAFVWN